MAPACVPEQGFGGSGSWAAAVSGWVAWPQRLAHAQPDDFLDDPLTPWAAPNPFGHLLAFSLGMVALGRAYARRQKLWRRPQLTFSKRLAHWPPADDQGVNGLRWPLTLWAAALPALAALLWVIAFLSLTLLAP